MRPFALAAAVLALCAAFVHAQTITTIDELGQTVVEVITIDPIEGLPTTETLQTLTTTATTATTTTPDQGQVGPVGQPASPGTGVTVYTYTTVDAAGDTQAIVDTFTPTFAPTTGGTITASPGTILDYSSWRASVGTNTVGVITNRGLTRWSLHPRWLAVGTALCAAFTGGAWLALA